MKGGREVDDYLADIYQAASKAIAFTEGLDHEGFLRDEKTQFAVIRALEIVGEAAKRVPEDVRSTLPAVPWKAMSGMRDKLIHEYFGSDPEVVWQTIVSDLPPLLRALRGAGFDDRID